jgi:hypothetical protein
VAAGRFRDERDGLGSLPGRELFGTDQRRLRAYGLGERTGNGDADRWPEILAANKDKISDPNEIKPGQELKIPS